MSEKKDEKKEPVSTTETDPAKTDEKKKDALPIDLNLKIENKTSEEILKILQEERSKRIAAEQALSKETEAKGKIAKDLEEKSTESEDYKSKLLLVAREKFEVKKKALMDKAATIIKDEERLKTMGEGITDLEKLKRTSFMLDTLGDALTKGSEADKALKFEEKKKTLGCKEKDIDSDEKLEAWAKGKGIKPKTPEQLEAEKAANPKGEAGTAPLTSAQTGEKSGEGYDSYEAMIRDLYRKKHGADPEIAAEADAILDELFKKWATAVKKKYAGKLPEGINVAPEKQPTLKSMTKKGGEATPR